MPGHSDCHRRQLILSDNRFCHQARTQATCAHAQGTYAPVGKLVPNCLQIWWETTFGFDIGMADKISNLRFLAAKSTFFTHFIHPCAKIFIWTVEFCLITHFPFICNNLNRKLQGKRILLIYKFIKVGKILKNDQHNFPHCLSCLFYGSGSCGQGNLLTQALARPWPHSRVCRVVALRQGIERKNI